MSRRRTIEDESWEDDNPDDGWKEDNEDADGWDEDKLGRHPDYYYKSDDGDLDMYPCPYCQAEIYEETERCPYCEKYISEEDAPAARKPLWIIIGAILCLGVVYYWLAQ